VGRGKKTAEAAIEADREIEQIIAKVAINRHFDLEQWSQL